MEPMNATAAVRPDGCEVWAPTQVPESTALTVASALNLPVESVKVHVTFLGGGFGRRANQDCAAEAALLSRAVGAPVQVVMTREDDITHDYYRPPQVHRLKAGLDMEGRIVAWRHHHALLPVYHYYDGPTGRSVEIKPQDFPAFALSNCRLESSSAESPVPRGWWRSVEPSGYTFAIETFLDELALAAGKDPVQFRLQILDDAMKSAGDAEQQTHIKRLRRVLETAASKADWGTPLSKGHGRGIAFSWCYRSYVAQVADVSVNADQIQVHRIVCAVDAGFVVNPNIAESNLMGGVLYGLSPTLKSEITVRGGRIEQSNFHDYQILKIGEVPTVDVHLVPSEERMGGIGEVTVPAVTAAVANAVFSLTGKRLRKLPLRLTSPIKSG
jgi:isoquinoline 1-oxidoreductase beta subunit